METYEEKEKKNEKNFVIMILILIALIIIIFLLIRSLGYIDHKPQIPTGNIDIFDIIFKQNCNNNCNCKCNSCSNGNCNNCSNVNNCNNGNNNNYNNSNNNSNNSIGEETPSNQSELTVFDNQVEYSQNTPLNIFTNTTYYVVEDIIAP